ncbi:MAG: TatD family hydrolase [bacterium]|nr:TatD family hydrolase [bacterium]
MITDSHAHVFWSTFDTDRHEVLDRARAEGVSRMVMVGTDLVTSEQCFELCADQPGLYPTAGIHPHDASDSTESAREAIEAMCRRDACVAVGETGLDYFKEYSPREAQLESFHWHLALARELDKPVIVHCRDAHEDTARAIGEYPGVRGVMHCYTMGPDELPPYLAAGLCISFSGVVTYAKNDANRAAAREVPSESLLVETDCPFLAPQGHRGKRNEPALVRRVVEQLSTVRGTSFEETAHLTSANADTLFALSRQDAP